MMQNNKMYEYRNLPCNVVSASELWCVCGMDNAKKCVGILEWCYDKKDAKAVLVRMRKDVRFTELVAEKYQR